MSTSRPTEPSEVRQGAARTAVVAPRLRQVVDWSAAVWAGVIAGAILAVFLVVVVPRVIGGNAWVVIRIFGSLTLGPDVLAPPATPHTAALAAAIVTHLVLSVGFSMVLAFIIHRGGLVTGILGGAAFGAAVYLIDLYTLTAIVPWFFALRTPSVLAGHVLFGALAGGIYEALEVEEFVPVGSGTDHPGSDA